MEHQLVIDVSAWNAFFGLVMGVAGIAGLVGIIIRLWIQPQVGQWITLALERESKATDAKISSINESLLGCQRDRSDRYHRLESDMQRSESKLAEDIREIKSAISEVGKLVPQVAEVKAQVENLTKAVDRLVAKS